MQEEHTAERLLTAVARGEPDALKQLFFQTLQESYTAVWRRANSFDARRGSGMAWLSQIARNRALNVENRTPKEADTETGSYQASEILLPDLATARIEYPELDDLMVNIDRLDDQSRQSLLTAYFEGAPRDELAQRLDMSAGNLTKHLRRGLSKLYRSLNRAG